MNSIAGPLASALMQAPAAIIIMSSSINFFRPRWSAIGPPTPAPMTAKHQACSNETDHVGLNVKIGDDNGHRHAENENDVTIEQRAPGREHPKPSLNPVQRRLIQQERQALW